MALSVALSDNDTFLITDETGHTVEAAATLSGLIFLKSVLAARRRYEGEATPPLGTDARPSQAMVKAFLETHKVERAPAAMTAAQIVARRERDAARLATVEAKFANLPSLEFDL